MNFDKKANVLAAVIVGTVLLAAGAILVQQLGSDEQKVDDQQRVTAEADTTMKHAIALGIHEWMLNGFSDQNKVWYSTGALPPDFTEASESLDNIANKKVDEYMDRLRNQDEDYYISPNVDINFDVSEPLDDDFDEVEAKVTEFEVGLVSEESSQVEDLSTTYKFPYQAWEIYSNMYDWMNLNADNLTQLLYEDALKKNPCQIITGGCDCAAISFDQGQIESLKLLREDVIAVLDERIAALDSQFPDGDISCSYEIDMMNIQNTEKIQWTIGGVGPNVSIIVEYNSTKYVYEMQRWEDEARTLPQGDSCGGLPQADSGIGIPADCTVRPDLGIDDGTVQAYAEPDPSANEECEGYVSRMSNMPNLAETMKLGLLAMDKKLAILLTVSCEDTSVQIETDHGLEPLSGEIGLRIAIALDCPLPTKSFGDSPTTCPGGSCFPAGTMISMADGSKKPIEKVVIGDQVLSYNTFSSEFRTGTVLELEAPVREGLYTIVFKDGGSIEVTNEHPFYTTKATGEVGWASIIPEETYKETKTIDNVLELSVGDSIMRQDGSWAEIVAITYDHGTVQTYNLKEVSTYDNFFADELLAHNKCCFAAGTPVTMADGSTKPIEDVNVGDFVMTYNLDSGELESSEVFELQQPIREGLYVITFENGKVLEITNDHPLYTDEGWAAIEVDAAIKGYALDKIEQLDVGDSVLQDDMAYSAVTRIEYEAGDVQTYTLKKVAKNKNFFANGFLAHNQKLIGYVGLACPFPCDTCFGCAPADGVSTPRIDVISDWQCIGPLPGMICDDCKTCDAAGNCGTDPSFNLQIPGYPCFDENGDNMEEGNGGVSGVDYADCFACDANGQCVMNPPEIVNLIEVACNDGPPCSKCSGTGTTPSAGGCNDALTLDMVCNDNSIDESERTCQICPAGSPGSCAPSSTTDGEYCSDCTTCSGGVCNAPAPGSTGDCDTSSQPCMKCSDTAVGVCVVDMSSSNCGACEKCASDGSCVGDSSKNGNSCGTCKQCSNGACVAANNGQTCDSSDGCTWTCQSGSCDIANAGGSCTKSGNTCGLIQRCTSDGCETISSERQKFCCGTAKCNQGSPCCTYTNQCAPCPGTT